MDADALHAGEGDFFALALEDADGCADVCGRERVAEERDHQHAPDEFGDQQEGGEQQ